MFGAALDKPLLTVNIKYCNTVTLIIHIYFSVSLQLLSWASSCQLSSKRAFECTLYNIKLRNKNGWNVKGDRLLLVTNFTQEPLLQSEAGHVIGCYCNGYNFRR